MRSLAIEVVLPEPLTPQIISTVGPVSAIFKSADSCFMISRTVDLAEATRSFIKSFRAKLGLDFVADSACRSAAHVGFDQVGKEFLDESIVDEPSFFADQIPNVGVEDCVGFGQGFFEPAKESEFLGGRLFDGRLFAGRFGFFVPATRGCSLGPR